MTATSSHDRLATGAVPVASIRIGARYKISFWTPVVQQSIDPR